MGWGENKPNIAAMIKDGGGHGAHNKGNLQQFKTP